MQADSELLAEEYDVRWFRFDTTSRSLLTLSWQAVKQLGWLLRELGRADLVVGWFVDYHLLLPVCTARVVGRPVAAVLGGYDCNALPEIGYGVFASSWRAPIARFVFRRLSLLLPTTASLMSSSNRYSEYPREHMDGVLTHIPGLDVPHRVVPLSINTDMWPMGPETRQRVILTVAYVRDERTFRVKGLDLFLAVAPLLPDVTFRVVGVVPEFAESIAVGYPVARNVELLPPRPQSELAAQYQAASVYAQLSRTEALPNVVKEAMCCGCVPVGSAVAGIPEVIGDAGYIVETPDLERIAETLRTALANAGPEGRTYARRRIVENFGQQRRKELLTACLTEMVLSTTSDRS